MSRSANGLGSDLAGKAAGGRRLIAVVHADMAGYSRLISLDDAGTLRRLRVLRRALIDPAIREHGGVVVQTGGDSLLVAFDSIDGAVRCAVKVQEEVPVYDGDQPPDRRIRFRIGINIGDVIPHATDLHGDGVNIAARLQAECPVGGVCVSRSVRDHVHGRLDLAFEPTGPLTLKNIARPVEAFVLRLGNAGATAPAKPRHVRFAVLATGLVLLAGAGAGGWVYRDHLIGSPKPPQPTNQPVAFQDVGLADAPRLSVVVLPFTNFGGLEDNTVDCLTEDMTTYLAGVPGFLVIARNSAFTYKGKAVDVRQIGQELGVRYAVEGSARGNGDVMRVTVQLVSTETGAHIFANQFDVARDGAGYNVDDVVRQITTALNYRLVDVESARSYRERSQNSDVDDLVLRARSIRGTGYSAEIQSQVIALLERAVALDPSSVPAIALLANAILDSFDRWDDPAGAMKLRKAKELIERAELLRPDQLWVLWDRVFLLALEGRYDELAPAARKAIEITPSNPGPHQWSGMSSLFHGKPAEAIVEFKQALRVNPRADVYNRYAGIGYASLFMGQYDQAAAWFEKSLAAGLNIGPYFRATYTSALAAAQALGGHIEQARETAAAATRLWPVITVRLLFPYNIKNAEAIRQFARIRDGLRLAGLRDHADEDADFGLPSDGVLHTDYWSPTPTTLPGARTIRTSDLEKLIEEQKPLVLDTSHWGPSIAGAVGLWGAGIGGTVSDEYQDRLGQKMQQLTRGDRTLPIVTMALNSERYQGRNLALRLVALGYKNIYWYRGGREAWEVAGLPAAELALQDW